MGGGNGGPRCSSNLLLGTFPLNTRLLANSGFPGPDAWDLSPGPFWPSPQTAPPASVGRSPHRTGAWTVVRKAGGRAGCCGGRRG